MASPHIIMVKLWCTPVAEQCVAQIAKRLGRLNGCKVQVVDDTTLGRVTNIIASPLFVRYYIWQLVPDDVDRVIFVNNDIIPMAPLPFNELPDCDFAAVADQPSVYEAVSARIPVIKRAGTYFNTNVFMATRKTAPLFKRILAMQSNLLDMEPWWGDQTLVNMLVRAAVEAGEIKFEQLDRRWNSLSLIDPTAPDSPYLISLAGGLDERYHLISQILDRFPVGRP